MCVVQRPLSWHPPSHAFTIAVGMVQNMAKIKCILKEKVIIRRGISTKVAIELLCRC